MGRANRLLPGHSGDAGTPGINGGLMQTDGTFQGTVNTTGIMVGLHQADPSAGIE